MSYCAFAPTSPLHAAYHDTEYGFPVTDDDVLFERLVLEINQAGLSWDLMLKKRESFQKAYKKFSIAKVASFTERDRERLMGDAGIVRNRLKINAAIQNAQTIRKLQKEYGSFAAWLAQHAEKELTKAEWVKLFKKTFLFTGGEIVGEFLMSVGLLGGSHDADCPVMKDIFRARVHAIVCAIPEGETLTYGEVAARAGNPKAARAVGAIMRKNQDLNIPCHRVVGAHSVGGYNGLRGVSKEEILRKERG